MSGIYRYYTLYKLSSLDDNTKLIPFGAGTVPFRLFPKLKGVKIHHDAG